MQNDLGDGINSIRSNNARPNRWIPAEVWQRQGMTAQEMTLPLGIIIIIFERIFYKYNINFRRYNTNKLRRQIEHCFESWSKSDGAEVSQRNLYAAGDWKNNCDSNVCQNGAWISRQSISWTSITT